MKLEIKPVGPFNAFALHDAETGNILPGQRETVIYSTVDGPQTIAVTFIIDGQTIRLATPGG